MGVYKYWEIDNNQKSKKHKITSKKDIKEKEKIMEIFEFNVQRYKNKKSRKEYVEISAIVNKEEYGTIRADLLKLESEIINLKSYGVVLERPKYIELSRIIADNYYSFEPIETEGTKNEITEENIEEILEILCDYIINNNIEVKQIRDRSKGMLELYHIPIREFNGEIEDSIFRTYSITDIKEKLLEKNYTHANKGKFDYVLSEDGKKIKTVSIHKEAIQKFLSNNGNGEQ